MPKWADAAIPPVPEQNQSRGGPVVNTLPSPLIIAEPESQTSN
jgi:hypothetical protein